MPAQWAWYARIVVNEFRLFPSSWEFAIYKPDIAIIPVRSNNDPTDSAHIVRLLRTDNRDLKTVIPHHHRLKARKGDTTPQMVEAEIKKLGLPVTFLNPELGKVYSFTK